MRKEKLFLLILLISISTLVFAQDFEGFETGDFSSYEWQLSGDANWLVTSSSSYEGTYCAQGGDINDSQATTLEITREVTDNGTISFYWKVGSESGWDYLRFYLDGTMIQEISGTVDWTQVTTNVTSGSHTFKWEYSKDSSVTTEPDTGWIDSIVFPPSVTYDNDLAGMSVFGNQSVNVNSTEIYEVFVKNNGYNSQDEYTVKLFKSGGEELASLDVTDTLGPDQTVAHDLSWVVPSNEPTGPTTIYGQVILTGDENSNNDLTSDLEITVYPAGLVIILDEGFEGGSLPAGWSQEYVVGDNDWIYQNGGAGTPGNPSSAHTGSYNAAFTHTTTGNSTKLITPEINLGTANEGVLTFWHAQANWVGDQDELHVYYKNSSGGAWTLIESFIEDTPAWTERIIFLPNPSTTYYVAFEGLDDYGYGVCVDDVLITGNPTVYDNDLAGQFISGNEIVNAGNTEAYSIEIKNVGNNSQSNYIVKLFKEGGEEVASLDVSQTIAPSEIVTHNLIWDLPASQPAGFTYLYGQVILAGDENINNDNTNNLDIQIFPQGIMEILVGDGTETNNRTPISFQHNNSLTETIYFSDELAGAQGMITALTYYNNFTSSEILNKPTALWIGETTQTNLTDGWIPSTSLTEVFNGTVSYPLGTNDILIQLTTPYFYNGGNLVVMAFRPMDLLTYGSTDYFLHDETLDYVDRTRYQRDNEMILDPVSPPDSSFTFEKFANLKFTFFLGAMGEVEGYVYDNDNNPIEGASVTIEETQTVTYTDDVGYYHFGNVIAGMHDFTAYIMGYSPQTISSEVLEDETTQVDFNLIPLGAVPVSGQVVGSDNPGVGLENAVVEITGFENYQVITDANGDFFFESVYTNITYDLQISHDDYDEYIDEINVGATALDLGTITVNEIADPPGNVQAVQNPEGTEVSLFWSSPGQGGGEFRYDDGTQVSQIGYGDPGPNHVFGAIHSYVSIIQEVSWYLTSNITSHSQVKIIILGLDYDNLPDREETLYLSSFLPNIDDEWNFFQLPDDVETPNGFFLGIVAPNQYTSIGLDDGIEEPWLFHENTQLASEDWQDENEEWIDIGDINTTYQKNMMIRASGINLGNTSRYSSRRAINLNNDLSRTFEGFNLYRFMDGQQANPEDWVSIANSIIDTSFVDTGWNELPNGDYQFAVRSLHTNGVESISAFSQIISRTTAESFDNEIQPAECKLIGNFPNPFNPSTAIVFSTTENIEEAIIVIYNLKGQKVKKLVKNNLTAGSHRIIWNGTNSNGKDVSSGIYYYKYIADDHIEMKKMLLLK